MTSVSFFSPPSEPPPFCLPAVCSAGGLLLFFHCPRPDQQHWGRGGGGGGGFQIGLESVFWPLVSSTCHITPSMASVCDVSASWNVFCTGSIPYSSQILLVLSGQLKCFLPWTTLQDEQLRQILILCSLTPRFWNH